MTATRNLQVTVKKGGGLTMKTLEGILAKTDVDGGEGKVSSFVSRLHRADE
jgi:DNA repair protein RAD50